MLIHPDAIRILMGCSVLNLLYRLDIKLVEIFFVYTPKLGIGGRLSMSAHNPKVQFVTGLLDSPKTKAKGLVLVRGPWHETSGPLGLPFDVNQSLLFPSLFYLGCNSCSVRWITYYRTFVFLMSFRQAQMRPTSKLD